MSRNLCPLIRKGMPAWRATIAWRSFTEKDVRDDRMIQLKHGQPLVFGKDGDKGIRLRGLQPEVVELGGEYSVADLLVHDETDSTLAYLLSRMFQPEFPVPVGILKRTSKPTHDQLVQAQIDDAIAKHGQGDLAKLLFAGETWTVS